MESVFSLTFVFGGAVVVFEFSMARRGRDCGGCGCDAGATVSLFD
jgi:hypothetical protein